MDRMLYVAMSGAKQMMLSQTAATHNLANSTTTGFRADFNSFRAQPVFGTGHPSRVFAMDERPGIDFSQGSLIETGNELDLAVNGQGWIVVQGLDGSEAYTRAGSLQITPNGLLQTTTGHPVMGDGGPIAIPPNEKLEIGSDGTISIRSLGDAPNTLSEIARIRLVNPDLGQLTKGEDGLFRMESGEQLKPDAAVTVVSGLLESSNVNAVEQMIAMINMQRSYELQVKAMKTAEENDAASAQLLRIT